VVRLMELPQQQLLCKHAAPGHHTKPGG
jgi:hypothetical protein